MLLRLCLYPTQTTRVSDCDREVLYQEVETQELTVGFIARTDCTSSKDMQVLPEEMGRMVLVPWMEMRSNSLRLFTCLQGLEVSWGRLEGLQ